MGGGTKRNGTLRAAAVAVGMGDNDGAAELVSVGVGDGSLIGDGVGESCATAVANAASTIPTRNPVRARPAVFAIRNSNIIAPINVREKIVLRLALREEFFIDGPGCELVV